MPKYLRMPLGEVQAREVGVPGVRDLILTVLSLNCKIYESCLFECLSLIHILSINCCRLKICGDKNREEKYTMDGKSTIYATPVHKDVRQ